jgi:gluconolactonase
LVPDEQATARSAATRNTVTRMPPLYHADRRRKRATLLGAKKIWWPRPPATNSKLVFSSKWLAAGLLVLSSWSCSGSPPPPPAASPDPAPPPSASRDDAARPPDDPPSNGPTDAAGDLATTVAPLPPPAGADAGPLGDFPLARLMAARPELYAAVTGHLEGVSWRDGELFFSIIPRGFFRVGADKKVAPYLSIASNGSFLLGDGTLLVCDDKDAVVQIFKDGTVGVLGTAGPKCNDLTVDGWGNIYFSDFVGTVFRITPDGEQTKAVSGLRSPNGVEVDRESAYLYILPRPADIYRVAITRDGPQGTPEKLGALDGVTDGCAFDAWGNLWISVYYGGKIGVFDPVKRQLLTYVPAGAGGLTNLTFGGPDRDTVFTTIDNHGLYRIPVGVAGFRGHPGAPRYTVKRMLDTRAGM